MERRKFQSPEVFDFGGLCNKLCKNNIRYPSFEFRIETLQVNICNCSINAQNKQAGRQENWIWGMFLEMSLNMNLCVSKSPFLGPGSWVLGAVLNCKICKLSDPHDLQVNPAENLTQLHNGIHRKMFIDGTLICGGRALDLIWESSLCEDTHCRPLYSN